jgi:hypothetical protein
VCRSACVEAIAADGQSPLRTERGGVVSRLHDQHQYGVRLTCAQVAWARHRGRGESRRILTDASWRLHLDRWSRGHARSRAIREITRERVVVSAAEHEADSRFGASRPRPPDYSSPSCARTHRSSDRQRLVPLRIARQRLARGHYRSRPALAAETLLGCSSE